MGLGTPGTHGLNNDGWLTEEEFNAELKKMGIEAYEGHTTAAEHTINQAAIRFKKDTHIFRSAIPIEAIKDLNNLHGIDAMPETRGFVLEGLCDEIRFLLLNAGEIDEFVDLFGWDALEDFATKFPIVEKWLADPEN